MNTDDLDELTPIDLSGNGRLPRLLDDDATPQQMVKAINGLAAEFQLMRLAISEQGTRIETFCRRIERAMGATDTIPAPAPPTKE